MLPTIDPAALTVTVLRAKYAISQLFLATKDDPKSHKVLQRLVTQTIVACGLDSEVEVLAYPFEPGAPFTEVAGFDFASLEVSLTYLAHLVEDAERLKEAFRDDPRPLICLEEIRVPRSGRREGSSQKYLVLGLDIEPRKPLPQVRLLSASKIGKVCGGYYRPIFTVKPPEAEE